MQCFTDAANRVQDALKPFAALEEWSGLCDDGIPKFVADARVQRAVADNGKATCVWRNQYQRGVGRFVAVKAGALELVDGSLERIHGTVRNDAHRDASGCAVFGDGNGARDRRAVVAIHGEKFT